MSLSGFHHGERAQGVIEFGVIATVMMLIFLGTVDFARFMYYGTAIRNAANTAAQVETTGCVNGQVCGNLYVSTTDDFAEQAAVCEGRPYVSLLPYPTASSWDFCNACLQSGVTCNSNDPCLDPGGTTTNVCGAGCTQDVCICRAGTCPATGIPAHADLVTVSVGYKFTPFSPLINKFFPRRQCWSGDSTASNGHTLCAMATGRVY